MDRHALERLGHHVVQSRVGILFPTASTWPTVCSSPCGPWPTSTWACARRAPGTYAMLENKLAWTPGSIDTILTGGEPDEAVAPTTQEQPHHRVPGIRIAPDQRQHPVARCPPNSCCWSYGAASSPPATDAPRAATTGIAALTEMVVAPLTGSSPGINPSFSSVPREDARTAAASGSRRSRRR